MYLKKFAIGAMSAAVMAGAIATTTAMAQDTLFIPSMVYRTGPFAPNGVPFANGYKDYFSLLNARDGGIGGVMLEVEECETGYNTKVGVECYEKLKGKGALVVTNIDTRDESGELLFSNRRASFVRGEGGFGGEPGHKAGNFPPERTPDLVAETPTLPQQALLYNLASGDENPLHTDPDVARKAGFDKPIIHGLCTFGMVCKTVVDYALQGDPVRIKRYQARFSGVVFPGETLETAMWMEEDRIVLNTRVKERGTPAISNAAITLHG